MKKISVLLLLFVSLLTVYSCSNNEAIEDDTNVDKLASNEFFKKNMSLFDVRSRALTNKTHALELYLANFADQAWDQERIAFKGKVFEDTGLGNDLVAGDGIYTAIEVFEYNEKFAYNADAPVQSLLKNPIVSEEFAHDKEFDKFNSSYNLRSGVNQKPGGGIKIKCDVEICSTGCLADAIWDELGCICVSNCEVEISFTF